MKTKKIPARKQKQQKRSNTPAVPTPPLSRFEGMVIGGVLACVGLSYALAYFSPIKPVVAPQISQKIEDLPAPSQTARHDTPSEYSQARISQPQQGHTPPAPQAQKAIVDSPGVAQNEYSQDDYNDGYRNEHGPQYGPQDDAEHVTEHGVMTDHNLDHTLVVEPPSEPAGNVSAPSPAKSLPRPIARADRLRFLTLERADAAENPVNENQTSESQATARRQVTALIGDRYDLKDLHTGAFDVPRQFLDHFPAALAAIEPASRRKEEFFKVMLPLILQVNETIIKDRNRLLAFRSHRQHKQTAPPAGEWLGDLAARYGFEDSTEKLDIAALLKRVDTIPTSLALAQAAIESAWGSSRFAQEGNAAFGQWGFDPKGGLKPRERAADKTHVVRRFARLIDAVRSYAHNLNTHNAYREFRAKRAQLRQQKGSFNGLDLVGNLQRYSQRGRSYVEDVKRLIKANRLTAYDSVKLAPERLAHGGAEVASND